MTDDRATQIDAIVAEAARAFRKDGLLSERGYTEMAKALRPFAERLADVGFTWRGSLASGRSFSGAGTMSITAKDLQSTPPRAPKNWSYKRVGIATATDPMKLVDGFVCPEARGLAVTPIQGSRSEYGVTHLRSGRLFASFTSRRKAARVAELIAPITDWTKGPRTIYKAGIGQRCRAIFERFR